MKPTWAPETADIPERPGVYRFMDKKGRVLYVGKAKNLKSRLTTYFTDDPGRHERTARMLEKAQSVTWTVVASEVDSLVLERSWIQSMDPSFNVRLRDGGQYPQLVLLPNPVVRLRASRQDHEVHKAGERAQMFGPWPGANTRAMSDAIAQATGVATCSLGVFQRARREDRPCLLFDLGRCLGPCASKVSEEVYNEKVVLARKLLRGQTTDFRETCEENMMIASKNEEFEKAVIWRERLRAVDKLNEQQTILAGNRTNLDAITAEASTAGVGWARVRIRGGVVTSVESGVAELPESNLEPGSATSEAKSDFDRREVLCALVEQRCLLDEEKAKRIVCPLDLTVSLPKDVSVVKGGVGDRDALSLAAANAHDALRLSTLRRARDLNARSKGAVELGEAIEMNEPPWRIMSMDIAHLQGDSAYGSIVVFEDGLEKREERRAIRIPKELAGNDVGSMAWMVEKRLKSDAPVPDLLLIDGGEPQVNAVGALIDELGVVVKICGLAKRMEELWPYGWDSPAILSRSSDGLYLAMRIRDAAHETANKAHRKSKAKSVKVSELDNIPGVGPARRKALLKRFKSYKELSKASVEELMSVDGVGKALAEMIVKYLKEESEGH